MALEQTINAEAKSRLKDIIAFSDASTAVNKWAVTGSMKSQIANSLLEIADIKGYDSGNKELYKHQIQRDKKDIENLRQ